MTQDKPSCQEVLNQLASENLLDNGWEQKMQDFLIREHNDQAWYVRVMVGFSAWLASWLLIGFMVGAAIIESEQATLMMGVVLVVGAVIARGISDNDFMSQMALAVSLAGEALIVFAMFQMSDSFEATAFSFILLEVVLIAFYIDQVHRFLSSASIVIVLAGLLFKWELQSFIHVIAIAGAAVFVTLVVKEKLYLAKGLARLLTPVKWGVLFGQLCVLMLSAVYIFPELMTEIRFYPNPWVSSIGLSVIFLYLVFQISQDEKFPITQVNQIIITVVCLAVLVATSMAPGLIMALVILLLGFNNTDRILIGVAIAFFAIFLTAYFYGIEVSLLMKSIILMSTGAVLIIGKLILKAYLTSGEVLTDAQ